MKRRDFITGIAAGAAVLALPVPKALTATPPLDPKAKDFSTPDHEALRVALDDHIERQGWGEAQAVLYRDDKVIGVATGVRMVDGGFNARLVRLDWPLLRDDIHKLDQHKTYAFKVEMDYLGCKAAGIDSFPGPTRFGPVHLESWESSMSPVGSNSVILENVVMKPVAHKA